MSINLNLRFVHRGAIAHRVRYARIDNIAVPAWVNVSPNPTTSPALIAQNVPNGEYLIESIPIYADGRQCEPLSVRTPGCDGLISINAYIQSSNLIVQYLAPSGASHVRIRIDYPNGGQFIANYINNGNNISIGLPENLNGEFFVYGQTVCDETSGFYSSLSSQVVVTKAELPSITQSSNTTSGATRTQIFTIGAAVSAGNRYVATVYSHNVTVVANIGDTAGSIAVKLKDAINATTADQWNDVGSAPAVGTPGFKPAASASGTQVNIILNSQNQFTVNAYIS